MSNKIHLIATGGTIDSYYDGTKDTAVPYSKSILPDFFKNIIKLDKGKLLFTQVCMKDSRDVNKKDLNFMLNTIEKSKARKIIITHGTYTMADSSRFIKANLKRKDQTIVICASLIPMTGFAPSDAPFNLGYAFAQVETLKPGIYVTLNGNTFVPEDVAKFVSQGKLYSLFNK